MLFRSSVTLSRMCLAPNYQGKGLSHSILRLVLAECKKRGYKYARILASEAVDGPIALYKSKGYRMTGRANMYDTDFTGFEVTI